MGFIIVRIISAILLLLALERQRYGYFTFLRFIVFGVAVYGAYFASKPERIVLVLAFVIIAILFNPLIPIHLRRGTWHFIDLAVAAFLIISIFVLRKSTEDSGI